MYCRHDVGPFRDRLGQPRGAVLGQLIHHAPPAPDSLAAAGQQAACFKPMQHRVDASFAERQRLTAGGVNGLHQLVSVHRPQR